MSEPVSKIKAADVYSDLSSIEIGEMLAEAAKVDALFQSGHISTIYLTSLTAAAYAVECSEPQAPATAA